MTFAEWLDKHREYANLYRQDVTNPAANGYGILQLGNQWNRDTFASRENGSKPVPPIEQSDIDKLYEVLNIKEQDLDPVFGHSLFLGIQELHNKIGLPVNSFLIQNYMRMGLNYIEPKVIQWAMSSPEAPHLMNEVLSLDQRNEKIKSALLENIIRNPNTSKPQLLSLLREVADSPKDLTVGHTYMRHSVPEMIKDRIGKAAFDAEVRKTPSNAAIHYIQGMTDLSDRSSQEIHDHIDGYNHLVSKAGGESEFRKAYGFTPYRNSSVVSSPHFDVEHIRKYGNWDSDDMHKAIMNPNLSHSMSHEELKRIAPVVYLMTESGMGRRFYSHLVDLTPNNGRPYDDGFGHPDHFFQYLHKNPTFVFDTGDVGRLHKADASLMTPDKTTPRFREYLDSLKPAYIAHANADEAGAWEHISDNNAKYGIRDNLNLEYNEELARLLPAMSHHDPQFAANWVNTLDEEAHNAVFLNTDQDHLQNIHPDVLNGMKNTHALYYFVKDKPEALRVLNAQTRDRLGEHVKSAVIPSMVTPFKHFHEGYGTSGIAAANFGCLDEYFAHAAKDANHRVLRVKRGSGTLRALRDYLEQAKERGVHSINPRDLPKDRTWNSVYQSLVTKNKDGSTTESKTIDWNPLRGKDGNVSAETVQAYIDRMQPIRVNVTESKWDGAQRHNSKSSNVVVFGMTNDHIRKLNEAGLWEKFMKVSHDLPRGHPQHAFALGWVRYTLADRTKGSHVFIDEVQNDIAKQLGKNSEIEDGDKKKIMDILYDGSHPSDMLHEAFHEYARAKKWHNRPFVIHSPESKRPISLHDQTGPVPVHYKKTYEEIVKQRFHVEPSTYGERKGETHQDIQGKPVWTGTIRKFEDMVAIPVSDGYSDWE